MHLSDRSGCNSSSWMIKSVWCAFKQMVCTFSTNTNRYRWSWMTRLSHVTACLMFVFCFYVCVYVCLKAVSTCTSMSYTVIHSTVLFFWINCLNLFYLHRSSFYIFQCFPCYPWSCSRSKIRPPLRHKICNWSPSKEKYYFRIY